MPFNPYHLLLVATGGALGAGGRYLVAVASLRLLGPGYPWGTLSVNVIGSLAMGVFVGVLARWLPGLSGQDARLFAATGFLGGFTTFSAFSLEVALLWQRGGLMPAAGYVAVSVIGSVAAVFLGLWLMRGFEA